MPFSRPVPSEAEYIQRFLPHVRLEQVENLQFSYHGAVGGEFSIARFGVEEDTVSQLRVHAQREESIFLDAGDSGETLKKKIAMCTRGKTIPEWFDFPFGKKMVVFIDRGDGTDEHAAYSREWYIDEDRGIVYFVMTEG
ncbi:hypothetical protein Rcae01_00317 [Novipirellula caenicola]|uniref:Uncharacterized protein n=2 Tax=Novipirellula caenicola TaxID=1536901 RepID=A0ABP9VN92_9BACT